MANDMENLARALLSSPRGGKILANMDKVSALLETPEGKTLLKTVSAGGGDALRQAAGAALSGEKNAISSIVSSLMSSPDGVALATDILNLVKE